MQLDNDKGEDDDDDEYLMDERGNIYDTRFRLIGRADDESAEDDEDLFKNHLKKDPKTGKDEADSISERAK